MMKEKRQILLLAQRPSDFVEMKRAAESFKRMQYDCHMVYMLTDNMQCIQVHKELDDLFLEGLIASFDMVLNNQRVFSKAKPYVCIPVERQERRFKISLRRLIRFDRLIYAFIRRIISHLSYKLKAVTTRLMRGLTIPTLYYFNLKLYRNLIINHQIDIVVLPEDVVGPVTALLIKAAHKCNVPAMILPYTICNQSEAFQSLKSIDAYSLKLSSNKIVGDIFHHWVMQQNDSAVIRLPAAYVIGHFLTRTTPPDPWMMNSGFANVIAVENRQMFNYYKQAGIPDNKMKIVGALYDDTLASYLLNKQQVRLQVYEELSIHKDKPLLLIGGCPNQLSASVPRFDFESLEEMVAFICRSIQHLTDKYHVILRPHPNYPELSRLFEAHGVVASMMPTDKLIAISDIYIAFASATIRWAIACGVPTINYDAFYYEYDDFKKVSGVLHANSKEEFIDAVKKLSDERQFDFIKEALFESKSEWGHVDGKSTERICALMEELCALPKVERTTC